VPTRGREAPSLTVCGIISQLPKIKSRPVEFRFFDDSSFPQKSGLTAHFHLFLSVLDMPILVFWDMGLLPKQGDRKRLPHQKAQSKSQSPKTPPKPKVKVQGKKQKPPTSFSGGLL
jgi:hypothetical protein